MVLLGEALEASAPELSGLDLPDREVQPLSPGHLQAGAYKIKTIHCPSEMSFFESCALLASGLFLQLTIV